MHKTTFPISILYAPGAGGRWLQCLIYCLLNGTDFPDATNRVWDTWRLMPHQSRIRADQIVATHGIQEFSEFDIVFGGPYYYNFWCNYVIKVVLNPVSPMYANRTHLSIDAWDPDINGIFYHFAKAEEIPVNLDYGDLFFNPDKFYYDLITRLQTKKNIIIRENVSTFRDARRYYIDSVKNIKTKINTNQSFYKMWERGIIAHHPLTDVLAYTEENFVDLSKVDI